MMHVPGWTRSGDKHMKNTNNSGTQPADNSRYSIKFQLEIKMTFMLNSLSVLNVFFFYSGKFYSHSAGLHNVCIVQVTK